MIGTERIILSRQFSPNTVKLVTDDGGDLNILNPRFICSPHSSNDDHLNTLLFGVKSISGDHCLRRIDPPVSLVTRCHDVITFYGHHQHLPAPELDSAGVFATNYNLFARQPPVICQNTK